ncbi:hypothetical protein [Roseobacter litoralis]|uniref:hypothetical protein n=1 Tax=Roseobacter litoralis TaxID=42443 RepID=UPI002495280A|nr:hypothetical protein [Roseobacter litoralis]
MTDEQRMQVEFARVQRLLNAALEELQTEGGDVRFFNAAFLSSAIKMTAEVEGLEAIERTITKVGQREMIRQGRAGLC